MIQVWKDDPFQGQLFWEGNSFLMLTGLKTGQLPVRNLTTNIYAEEDVRKFTRPEYQRHLKMTPKPCWACPSHHLHMVEVTEGPYKGYVGEEPDYELWSQTSNLIGNKDIGASIMLSDVVDRLGLDGNEGLWIISLVMECYEKGIVTKKDTGGLEMRWGNVEGARDLLHKIARREGIGDVLAEGIKRATQHIGGEALNMGVYIEKGHAPRGHDHRPRWLEELDYATSGVGTIETGPIFFKDLFDPDEVSTKLAKDKWRLFADSLVLCLFPTMMMPVNSGAPERMVRILNAATGWDFTPEEANLQAHRIASLLRTFNLRHGIGTDVEFPSPRYGSTPQDGPAKGMGIMPHWDYMLENYYRLMGWDRASGRPLPETLKSMGLEHIINDIW
jgi:aldehyde:ferredoxin oxidoreductase